MRHKGHFIRQLSHAVNAVNAANVSGHSLSYRGRVCWEKKYSFTAHLVVHDPAVRFDERFRVERRLAVKHFVHANAEGPPVAFRAVASLAVLHGLNERERII